MRFLACLDFSDIDEQILDHAGSLARAAGAELLIAHIAAPEPDFVGYDEPGGPRTEEDRLEELADERATMKGWVGELRKRGVAVGEPILRMGPTVDTILALGEETDADVIVVARVSHSRIHKLLIGSTSEALVQRSQRPVLLLPPRSPSTLATLDS